MLRAFAGMSALALALICAATMARAGSTQNVNPNAGGGSGTLNVKPNAGGGSGTLNVNPNAGDGSGTLNVKGAGSGAAPASAPSGPYAASPYSASSSRQLVWVRPPPDYRANAAQLGVSQATLDILLAQVKARILADPNYISEPPNVNLDVPTEFPPYWYNGGAAPSGDQLEADANYLVERALGTGLNSPGTKPTARLIEVLKQLSDPQDPPGRMIDNPNYKPPVASEQASSGDSESDSTAKSPGEEPTRTADPNAGKVIANKEPGNPSGGDNDASGSGDQADGLQRAGEAITGIRDAGVLNAATSLGPCLAAGNPLGKCLDAAKTSGKIGVACQAVSLLGDYLISSSGQAFALLCGSMGGYQACVRAGGNPDECMKNTQSGLPPALFCTAIATLIPGGSLAARAAPVLCSTVAPAGWEALVAWVDATGKDIANDYLQPIQDAVLACDFEKALSLALQLEKQREQWAAMAPLSGAQGYLSALFPNMPTLIKRLVAEDKVERTVIGLITKANDTTDPAQRKQFLNDALTAAAAVPCLRDLVPPYWPPKTASAPPPRQATNTGSSTPPPPATGSNVICGYSTPMSSAGNFSQVIPVNGTVCPSTYCLTKDASQLSSAPSGGQCGPNQTKASLYLCETGTGQPAVCPSSGGTVSAAAGATPATSVSTNAGATTSPPSAALMPALSTPMAPLVLRPSAASNSGASSPAGPPHPCTTPAASGIHLSPNTNASTASSGTNASTNSGTSQTSQPNPKAASLPQSGQQTSSPRSQTTTSRSQTTTPSSSSSGRSVGGQAQNSSRFSRGSSGFASNGAGHSGLASNGAGHSGFGGGGGFGRGGGFGGGGGHRSDIRLKEDIVPLGRLDNGIGLYRFRYRGDDHTAYVGVMAQEVQALVPEAVSRGRDGYLRVDYDRLGLEFLTWDEWVARGGTQSRTVP